MKPLLKLVSLWNAGIQQEATGGDSPYIPSIKFGYVSPFDCNHGQSTRRANFNEFLAYSVAMLTP